MESIILKLKLSEQQVIDIVFEWYCTSGYELFNEDGYPIEELIDSDYDFQLLKQLYLENE